MKQGKIADVGVVTAHPIYMAYKLVLSVFRTWRYASKLGLPCNKWYGVYEAGTEVVLAHTGCLPGADDRARQLAKAINTNN
jgi:hypothetical protein